MSKKPFLAGAADGANGHAVEDEQASRTLIERAHTELRDDIIEGRLAPGEKLRVEHLKARYGVGAGTLREAITRLVSDALVEAEGQRGFRVSPITLQDIIDITDLRLHIEIEALRQSIRRGDAAWAARLQAAFDEMAQFERPIRAEARQRWERLNTRFHEALISDGASPWALRTLRLLSRHGERYRRYAIALPGSVRDVHAEHEAILRAALGGHEARAALALEAHVRTTVDLLREAWSHAGPPAAPADPA